jgi:hypothetical protein
MWLPPRLRPLSRDLMAVVALSRLPAAVRARFDPADAWLDGVEPSAVLGPSYVGSDDRPHARPRYALDEALRLTALYGEGQRVLVMASDPLTSLYRLNRRVAEMEGKK